MALGISMRAAPGACAAVSWARGRFLRHDSSAWLLRRRRTGRPLRLRVGERCRARVSGRAARRHGTSPPVGAGIRRTDVGSRRRPRRASPVEGRATAPRVGPDAVAVRTRLLLLQILRRGFGIPLLDEPLEDLVHVHDLQSRDRNDDPGVLRDVVQVQVPY